MKKKLLTLTLTLCVCAIPLWAIVSGRSLTNTLKELCSELQTEYQQRAEAQQRFNDDYERDVEGLAPAITAEIFFAEKQDVTIVTLYCLMNYKERNEKSFAKKCVF